MLQLGLRSFAGGNLQAALDRLGASEQNLRTIAASGSSAADTEAPGDQPQDEQTIIQLGAVCGSQGDCHRRLGDQDAASRKYQQSVDLLQTCKRPSDEVRVHKTGVAIEM